MDNNDNSLHPEGDKILQQFEDVGNQQLVEKGEWDRIADAIRVKVKAIQDEFSDPPRKFVRKRKGAGGKEWDYVRADFFEEALHKHCPDWSYATPVIQFFSEKDGYPKPEFVAASSIAFTIAGVRRVVGAVGTKQVEFTTQESDKLRDEEGNPVEIIVPVSGGAKSADTDCFKRCCVRALRLAGNIYRKLDEEQYAQFALSPKDIAGLESLLNSSMKVDGSEKSTNQEKMRAQEYLQAISAMLENVDDTTRYEALEVAKECKRFLTNWRKNHESEK